MSDTRPRVFTIPPHVAFVDALAAGLIARTRDDPMRLARATVLLPNRRAVRALTDAFVRLSDGGGLLLPRMTPIGDIDEDEALGSFADDLFAGATVSPAVDSCERRLLLCKIVRDWKAGRGEASSAVEALRLADELARTLDGLEFEEKDALDLMTVAPDDLAQHWQRTLEFVQIIYDKWPGVLTALQKVDSVRRRNELMHGLITRWGAIDPPQTMIVAAGMVATAPVVADLLRVIARLPDGMVVLPGLDCAMAEAEWQAIRCHVADPDASPRDDSESHPQFSFRCLLERMRVARGEVETWPVTTAADGPPARTAALARAMAPAQFTNEWRALDIPADALDGVRLLEAADPGEEAQAIALAMRRCLETPGRTAALVTPDRGLARRVAAHLQRWGLSIDDSAGTPLRVTPPGTFMLALAEAAAQGFAPVPLLALLKHPLTKREGRMDWLDQTRALDLALRGVRPPPGLDGVDAQLNEGKLDALARRDPARAAAIEAVEIWWRGLKPVFEPLEALFARPLVHLVDLIDRLRAAAAELAGDELWRGPAGRALGEIVLKLEQHGSLLDPFAPPDAPGLLGAFFDETAVRPPFGRHPRLAVYGVLEARLQRADLVILGGLNEGVWPASTAPDPWLAPAARAKLGLPGLERRVGLAAHDFVQAMGAVEVLVTRARRDASAPTVPSRFWLRLEALGGERLKRDGELLALARALDRPAAVTPAPRPAPAPPSNARPRQLSVTQAEKLRADPYSFYAEKVLGLRRLDRLDEDPTAAERGTFIHEILERWAKERPHDPAHLPAVADILLGRWDHHPLMKALWAPRVRRAIDWAAETAREWAADGWTPVAAEARGRLEIGGGVTLTGVADRVDRNADGALAIVDYKTGGIPSHAQLSNGFALQLGLLAAMAEAGRLGDAPAGAVALLSYWKLSGGRTAGEAKNPLLHKRQPWTEPADFIAQARAVLDTLRDELLLGTAPFEAKLHPEYASRYTDHDHLARVAEWLGRGA